MDYNTQREALLPEYGRYIQETVREAKVSG